MSKKNDAAAGSSDRDFVISRLFDAPRDLVFKAWTEPKHMARWWGPHHFTCPVCEMDVRPGGDYRLVMHGPDGKDYPMHGQFSRIAPPERLVMTMEITDHPIEWYDMIIPDRDKSSKPVIHAVQTVTFEEEGGKTRLTVRTRFDTKAIRDGMVKAGMTEGWSQSLERLATLLPKI